MRPVLIVLALALAAAGCGKKAVPVIDDQGGAAEAATPEKKPAELIVGKWEPTEKALAIEFGGDGSLEWVPFGIKGKYRFVDDEMLELHVGDKPTQVKTKVGPNELEITPLEGKDKGRTIRFKRVSEFSKEYRAAAGPVRTPAAALAKVKEELTFKEHEGPVNAVVFSPDGELVASGGDDRVVKVWKRKTGEVIATLTGHKDKVEGLAWSPRGDLLASTGGGIKLWDAKAWKEVPSRINGKQSMGRFLAFAPDGSFLIATGFIKDNDEHASMEVGIRLWDVKGDRRLFDITQHNSWVMGLATTPDCRYVATTYGDGTVRVWDVQTGKSRFSRKESQSRGVALSPDGKALAVGWHGVELLPWQEGGGAAAISVQSRYPNRLQFLSNNTVAASFSDDISSASGRTREIGVQFLDVHKREPVAEARGHAAAIQGMAVSEDGKWLATAANDSLVKVWDVSAYAGEERRPRSTLKAPTLLAATKDPAVKAIPDPKPSQKEKKDENAKPPEVKKDAPPPSKGNTDRPKDDRKPLDFKKDETDRGKKDTLPPPKKVDPDRGKDDRKPLDIKKDTPPPPPAKKDDPDRGKKDKS